MSSAVVVALEQLQDVCKTQKLPDTHKTAARLVEARRDVQRRQPVHHYRLLGLPQSCAVDEVRLLSLLPFQESRNAVLSMTWV